MVLPEAFRFLTVARATYAHARRRPVSCANKVGQRVSLKEEAETRPRGELASGFACVAIVVWVEQWEGTRDVTGCLLLKPATWSRKEAASKHPTAALLLVLNRCFRQPQRI